jgi:hypothetical protein
LAPVKQTTEDQLRSLLRESGEICRAVPPSHRKKHLCGPTVLTGCQIAWYNPRPVNGNVTFPTGTSWCSAPVRCNRTGVFMPI